MGEIDFIFKARHLQFIATFFLLHISLTCTYAQWESMEGPYGGFINDLKNNAQFQFAGTDNGLFRSGDNGDSWQQININNEKGLSCLDIGVRSDLLIAHVSNFDNELTERRLFKSENNGDDWSEIPLPSTYPWVTIAMVENDIYLNGDQKLWVSRDLGNSWNSANLNTFVHPVNEIAAFNNVLYVLSGGSIFKTTNIADQFIEISLPPTITSLQEIYVDGDLILGANQNGRLCKSEDGGLTWNIPGINISASKFAKIGSAYFALGGSSLYKSDDAGKTWTPLNTENLSTSPIQMITTEDKILISSWYKGIQASTDLGESMHQSDKGIFATYSNSLLINGNKLYVGNDYQGISTYDFSSHSWSTTDIFSTDDELRDLFNFNNELFITTNSGLFKTSYGITEWKNITPSDLHYFLSEYSSNDETLYVTGYGQFADGLFESLDYGLNWGHYDCSCTGEYPTGNLYAQSGDTIYVGKSNEIYRSYDNGNTWTILPDPFSVEKLVIIDNVLFGIEKVGNTTTTPSRLFASYDHGDTWGISFDYNQAESYIGSISALTTYDHIIIGSLNGEHTGVAISFDSGLSWNLFNEGLGQGRSGEITHDDEYLYLATSGQGVWRRKISDLYTTSTQPVTQKNEISIFPNPTNGNFTINLYSQYSGKGELVITDLSGKVCLNKEIVLSPQLKIEAESLSSGLYFLSLRAGGKNYTGKIVIQK